MRAGDKFASLEYAPLIVTRAATMTIKLLSDTENKTKNLDPVGDRGGRQINTGVVAHSPWNFQILKLREMQKREACIKASGVATKARGESYIATAAADAATVVAVAADAATVDAAAAD